MALSPQEAVPQQLRPLFEDVVSRTDAFCLEHLTDEYAQMCRQLAAALCRKSPTPLARGQVESWACAVVYTIGSVNFLFDKSQTPHMSAGELCERFGVNKSTTSAKTRKIFDALDIGPYDPRWCLPSKLDDNPLAWLIEVDGLIVDARSAPRPIQEEAFRLGLIPHLPGQEPASPDDEPMPAWPVQKQLGGQPPRYNFLLNPYPDVRFTSCPRCDEKTKQRKLPLVIHIEGPLVMSLNITNRYCPSCDLLITHQDILEDLLTAIFLERAPEMIGNEYLVLGTVDRAVWRRGVEGVLTGQEIIENLHDFKEWWDF